MKKKEPLRIAVSGLSGCGNTTLSRLLSEKLELKVINYTFRNLAEEQGLSFEEMHALAEKEDKWDVFLDNHQVELARKGSCVLASRLAIWFLKEADCKIYLETSSEIRFKRIAQREGISFEESRAKNLLRDERDIRRYKRLYNINVLDLSPADLILNTDIKTPDVLVKEIISFLEHKKLILDESKI